MRGAAGSRCRFFEGLTRLRRAVTQALLTVAIALAIPALPALAQVYTSTTVHAFEAPWNPAAALVQSSDGNFYGTTFKGGASNYGAVFKITPSGTLTTLYSFAGSDGASLSVSNGSFLTLSCVVTNADLTQSRQFGGFV